MSITKKTNEERTIISKKNTPEQKLPFTKPVILVLPPYDEIANAGVSPDIQKIIESELHKNDSVNVLNFPYKALMNVPYQMIYDKKFCGPILAHIQPDIIIMSRLITDNERKPGHWPWTYSIKIYNPKKDIQIESIYKEQVHADEISKDIKSKQQTFIKDIFSTLGQ